VVTTPHDDVDEIVQAWRRERPDLDVAPLEVLSRVSRIAKHVDSFRAEAFRASGLLSWEFDVLAALRRAGKPYRLSPKALLKETLVSSGAMTHRLTKLETRGFVVRTPDPDDGRGVVVHLTKAGVHAVDTAFSALVAKERALLEGISEVERLNTATTLRHLNRDLTAP
jgi:DNA-binding MarR family transcriptional regulator